MNICVIGAGYVGLTSASVLANLGNHVICIDKNINKINELNQGIIPIFEPGLKELIVKNKSHLMFSHNLRQGIAESTILLIAVGTPSNSDGSSDLSYIYSVIDEISPHITSYKTIITKSTVPPGTNEQIIQRLQTNGVKSTLFDVVSNPEFLREGTAIQDMIHADRIVVGLSADDHRSIDIMKKMYVGLQSPYIVTSLNGAEMIKYASNSFLALKISFINELARICDQFQVNIQDVANGMGTDARISPHFLQAGLGFGGSCFPKDVRALEYSAKSKHIKPIMLEALQEVNQSQVDVYVKKIQDTLPNLKDKTISVLGIAFKANTDDIRESQALRLIEHVSKLGAKVSAYDPKASLPFEIKNVNQVLNLDESLQDADCVIIATDWGVFKELDWTHVKSLMRGNTIIDARNCLDKDQIEKNGLNYIGLARP